MILASKILTLFVAVIHFYFLILEMFLWTKPKGLKAFGLTKEFAEKTKVLAANQGLYNGFLSTGLFWSIFNTNLNISVRLFFLICVIIAGVYGSYSLKKKTVLYVQAMPALIALIITLLINI